MELRQTCQGNKSSALSLFEDILYNKKKLLEILQKGRCVFVYLLAFYVDIW